MATQKKGQHKTDAQRRKTHTAKFGKNAKLPARKHKNRK